MWRCEMKQTANRRKRGAAGVTLIEMLVVVTIIGLFVALVGPRLWSNVDKAKITAARAQIQGFMARSAPTAGQRELSHYRAGPGGAAREAGGRGRVERAVYAAGDSERSWGHDWLYKFPGDHGDEPDIISYGADGQPGATESMPIS